MSGTKIIAANGKPIKAGNRALKQNYKFGGSITYEFEWEVNFPPMASYSFYAMGIYTGPKVGNPNASAKGLNMYATYQGANKVDDLTRTFDGNRKQYYDRYDPVNQTFENLDATTYAGSGGDTIALSGISGEVFRHFLTINEDDVNFRFWKSKSEDRGYSGTFTKGIGETIDRLKFIGSNGNDDFLRITRVLLFSRSISARELEFLFNNGNSNSPLSSLGLVAEFNFLEASIINIEGVDNIGFIDETGSGNHLIITGGLPSGTTQEQVDYLNNNVVEKWLY